MKSRQLGLSFVGLLFWAIVLSCVGVVVAQVAPTVMEYQTVMRAVNRAKEGTTVQEVKTLYERQAEIDRIKVLSANDLEISKGVGDKVIISFKYQEEIHLFGPAYLTLKYSGQTK